MSQHVSGNRMPPVQQQQGITMTRNPTMINVTGAAQAPPIYQGGPSPGMPQMSGTTSSNMMQQQGPSPGVAVSGFIQSPAANQNMMSPSPMAQGPRSVGSPLMPMSNQSIATPQQSDTNQEPRQDEQAYLDKVKALGKYIEPLRRMIARIGNF